MSTRPDDVEVRETDIRPRVRMPSRGLPLWVFGVGVLFASIVLFSVLNSRRQTLNAPAVEARRAEAGTISPPPALYIPPELTMVAPPTATPPGPIISPTPAPSSAPVAGMQRPAIVPEAPIAQTAPTPAQPNPPARRDASPVLVIDNGAAMRAEPAAANQTSERRGGAGVAGPSMNTDRARAGAFANRGTTISQGTLISAVLESALDSTKAGFARAIVSRDVRGFDGTRILIPRGSRLIGEYGSDTAAGQKRALITWTRLIRPDGATIAIESPVADTLGRTGVRAQVNTHFFERFSGAILQSALDVGVNLAARQASGTNFYALPGSLSGLAAQTIQPQQITPTLTVKRGTSVSVFVARDLDFTGVEQAR